MSGIDKIIAAIVPPESDEKRREAREKARLQARPGDWLSMILDQHEQIDRAFAAVRSASDASARRAAEKHLGTLLTGHTMAEEAVVYPALAQVHEQHQANLAYSEQAAAKMQMAALETLDPLSQDYLDKLGHLESAVKHHVYEEEHKWFLDLLSRASPELNQRIAARFREEFERYMGEKKPLPEAGVMFGTAAAEPRSFAPPDEQRPSPT